MTEAWEGTVMDAIWDRASRQYSKPVYVPDFDPEDVLTDEELWEITKSEEPAQKFCETIHSKYLDAEHAIREKLIIDILADEEVKSRVGCLDVDKAADFIRDVLTVEYPADKLMGEVEVLVDLVVDHEDWLPNVTDRMPDDPCALLWLVRQQGYKKSDLKKALKEGGSKNRFLNSVVQEMGNAATDRNLLTFLVRMTMNEFCMFATIMQCAKRGYAHGYVKLDAEVTCGLYDPWNGGGSLMGIKCEHDFHVPFDKIISYYHDGATTPYSARKVFNNKGSLWDWNYRLFVVTDKEPREKELRG